MNKIKFVDTNVSEENTASIFRAKVSAARVRSCDIISICELALTGS
jgi:hypothetical protein